MGKRKHHHESQFSVQNYRFEDKSKWRWVDACDSMGKEKENLKNEQGRTQMFQASGEDDRVGKVVGIFPREQFPCK